MDTKALRQKVLDLAIRGKLVPQDPNDEPASVLLERIRQQKQQMVKDGKLKAKDIKNDTIIFVGEDNLHYEKFADGSVKCIEDEIPFDLPDGWAWALLSHIVCVLNGDRGQNYPAKSKLQSEGIPFVSASNIEDGVVSSDGLLCLSDSQYNALGAGKLVAGDIVYCIRGSLGKCGLFTMEKGAIASSLVIVRSLLSEPCITGYIFLYLNSAFADREIKKYDNGSAQPNLAAKDFMHFLIPVPPLEEMQRITEQAREALGLVKHIQNSKNELLAAIAMAKSKILDLAIRGQLVPQDPADEPASVLLERIRAEKEELIRQGKIKRDKKESIIFRGEDNSYYEKIGGKVENINDEIPFELPEGWAWCRGYSCFEGMESTKPQGDFFDYIDIDAIDNRLHRIKEAKHLPVSDAPSRASRAVKDGSVLFSLVRPYLENIALVEEKHSNCIASTGFYVCNSNGVLLPEFMFFLMISGYVVNGLNQYMKGDNSPSISKDNIENWLYPVPPIEEQQAICAKLKTVFTLVENVEKSLN